MAVFGYLAYLLQFAIWICVTNGSACTTDPTTGICACQTGYDGEVSNCPPPDVCYNIINMTMQACYSAPYSDFTNSVGRGGTCEKDSNCANNNTCPGGIPQMTLAVCVGNGSLYLPDSVPPGGFCEADTDCEQGTCDSEAGQQPGPGDPGLCTPVPGSIYNGAYCIADSNCMAGSQCRFGPSAVQPNEILPPHIGVCRLLPGTTPKLGQCTENSDCVPGTNNLCEPITGGYISVCFPYYNGSQDLGGECIESGNCLPNDECNTINNSPTFAGVCGAIPSGTCFYPYLKPRGAVRLARAPLPQCMSFPTIGTIDVCNDGGVNGLCTDPPNGSLSLGHACLEDQQCVNGTVCREANSTYSAYGRCSPLMSNTTITSTTFTPTSTTVASSTMVWQNTLVPPVPRL